MCCLCVFYYRIYVKIVFLGFYIIFDLYNGYRTESILVITFYLDIFGSFKSGFFKFVLIYSGFLLYLRIKIYLDLPVLRFFNFLGSEKHDDWIFVFIFYFPEGLILSFLRLLFFYFSVVCGLPSIFLICLCLLVILLEASKILETPPLGTLLVFPLNLSKKSEFISSMRIYIRVFNEVKISNREKVTQKKV